MDTPENSDESEKMRRKKKGVKFGNIRKLWPRRTAGKRDTGFQVCFLPPASPDSVGASTATAAGATRVGKDERMSEFGPEFLKALIEKNDFYSEDCNVHIDV